MNLQELYRHSWFANLAYVPWNESNVGSATEFEPRVAAANAAGIVPAVLGNTIFDPAQEGWFIAHTQPNDTAGFAATLFSNGDRQVLAIRGTELNDTLVDLVASVLPGVQLDEQTVLDLLGAGFAELGGMGLAIHQGVSLFNYVQRLTAPAGEAASQLEFHSALVARGEPDPVPAGLREIAVDLPGLDGVRAHYWLEPGAAAAGLGRMDAWFNASVTGHSLGGHLAALAARLFPTWFHHAVTFNAPGFDPLGSARLTEPLLDLFADYLPAPGAASFQALGEQLVTVISEGSAPGDDLSIVPSLALGTAALPSAMTVHTERNSHSIDQLMDDLALQSTFEFIDPALAATSIRQLFDSASADAGYSSEALAEALARLYLRPASLAPVEAGWRGYEPDGFTFERRAALHELLLEIRARSAESGLPNVIPLAGLAADELAARAADSFAYRSALHAGRAFAVVGDDALYAADVASGALESDNASPAYLADRATWLARILARHTEDVANAVPDAALVASHVDLSTQATLHALAGGGRVIFGTVDDDRETPLLGTPLADRLYGDLGDDTLIGAAGGDSLEGGRGADVLMGGAGADQLEGGYDDDVLYGGDEAAPDDDAPDILRGGVGNDRYVVSAGDEIFDEDGVGTIGIRRGGTTIDPATLSLWTWSAPHDDLLLYRSDTGVWAAHRPSLDWLRIAGVDVHGFRPGDFGIHPVAFSAPPSLPLLAGTSGGDMLVGTSRAEAIDGAAGADEIRGLDGDDVLTGGVGDDALHGDLGDDELHGGEGRDALSGGDGDDRLHGESGDDVLSGEQGGDLLLGGDGGDVVGGGAGVDVLVGGAGDDLLLANANFGSPSVDWQAVRRVQPTGHVLRDPRLVTLEGFAGFSVDDLHRPDGAGENYLYGEGGEDYLIGGAGADWIDGGTEDDVLMGGAGDDVLDGGPGDDHIRGDGGGDRIHGGSGNDFIVGHGSGETGLGRDTGDQLFGDDGDDELQGGDGADSLSGGSGNDLLGGQADGDTLHGEAGDDELQGGDDDDALYGEAGIDRLFGNTGDDRLHGGDGDDILVGGDGSDRLYGDGHADQLLGEDGSDSLYGGAGADLLRGGGAADLLAGNAGDDRLDGGDGNDRYVFARGDGHDRILPGAGEDLLQLTGDLVPAPLIATEVGGSLVLAFGGGDSITLDNWRAGSGVAAIEFGNGRILSREHLRDAAHSGVRVRADTAGLVGTPGDDWVDVALADGTVNAGEGNDIFALAPGTRAFVDDRLGLNVLRFAPGIGPSDLTVAADVDRYRVGGPDFMVEVPRAAIARYVFDEGLVLDAPEFAAQFASDAPVAPRLARRIGHHSAYLGARFDLALHEETFVDVNPGTGLNLDARLRDGGPLPGWLHFDAASGRFTGLPERSDAGVLEVVVTATDETGLTASDAFTLDIMSTLADGALVGFDPGTIDGENGTWLTHGGGLAPDPAPTVAGFFSLGDLNADGYDDALVLHETEADAVTAQLVFGRRPGFTAEYAPATPDGYGSVALANFALALDPYYAANPWHYAPRVGDLNGDRIDDAVIGGKVLLGQRAHRAAVVDFARLPSIAAYPAAGAASPGLPGVLPPLAGALASRFEQRPVTALGDVSGDGLMDFGAADTAGATVVFGTTATTVAPLDLDRLDGTRGFTLVASPYPGYPSDADALEASGWGTDLRALGDVNGDGLTDVGLSGSPYLFREQSQYSAVVFGSASGHGGALALDFLAGGAGFLVAFPRAPAGYAPNGSVLAPAGDLDGDGYADIVAHSALTGDSLIIHGQPSFVSDLTVGTPADDRFTVAGGSTWSAGGGDDAVRVELSTGFLSTGSTGSGDNIVSFGTAGATSSGGFGGEARIVGGPDADRYQFDAGRYVVHLKDASGQGRDSNVAYVNLLPRGSIVLTYGSVVIDFGAGGPLIHLEDLDPDDVLGGPRTLDRIEFKDGTAWTYEQLLERGFDHYGSARDDAIAGTSVVDRMYGAAGNDRLKAGAGNDSLMGKAGADWLDGGAGVDKVYGGAGNDSLRGGPGDDFMVGGRGGDRYYFARGDGEDKLIEEAPLDQPDVLQLQGAIRPDDLWLWRSGYDLMVGIQGTGDRVRAQKYYTNGGALEVIRTADGRQADAAGIQRLVEAMAGFAKPSGSMLPLLTEETAALAPVLAAVWRPAA